MFVASRNHSMGNPTSGLTVQTTMSVSKGRHRQSRSVASLQLEKLSQQESRCNSHEKMSTGTFSPRATEENSIASFLGDKKMKRRTRSSLGGSDEFVKGLELHGLALLTEEKKPMSFNPFKGHRRIGSGSLTPKSAESPRTKGTSTPPGKEKHPVAKIASSLFRSPTKLERSMSLSRVAHRPIPEVEVACWRSPVAIGELILPGKRDKLSSFKEQELPLRQSWPRQICTEQSSQRDTGICASLISKARPQYAFGFSEHGQNKGAVETIFAVRTTSHSSLNSSPDSSPVHRQKSRDAFGLTARSLNLALLKKEVSLSLEKRSQQVCTEYGAMGPLSQSMSKLSSVSNRNLPSQETEKPPVKSSDLGKAYVVTQQMNLEQRNIITQSVESVESVSITHCDAIPNPSSMHADSSIQEGEPCTTKEMISVTLPPLKRFFSMDPSHPKLEGTVMRSRFLQDQNPSAMANVSRSGIPSKNNRSFLVSPEKVTEEELTEAAVLSSLVCENNPNNPALASEDSQQCPVSLSEEGESEEVRLNRIKETVTENIGNPDALLTKSISFEPGLGERSKLEAERRSKLRKRQRSVSASGIGAMLLKVVRVSDSGPILTRKLPKVGPEVCGVDSMRAREYVIKKTSQIGVGQAESPVPAAAISPQQGDSKIKVNSTSSKVTALDLDTGNGGVELLVTDTVPHEGVDPKGVKHVIADLAEFGAEDGEDLQSALHIENVEGDSALTPAISNPAILKAGHGVHLESSRTVKPRRKHGSKRHSYDFDTSIERKPQRLDATHSNRGLGQPQTSFRKNKLQTECALDGNVSINQENSRGFVSILQASSRQSLHEYRLAPSSMSILGNPSFSSSHQDRLWEEQAEAYSSGGRGTPGREDEAAANVFLHSPSPGGGAISSDDQLQTGSGYLRKGQTDSNVGNASASTKQKGQSKKRGRPRTPLRSLLAEDVNSKNSSSMRSPEGGHFLQQIISRIRGNSSKSSSPKSPEATPKRRNTLWSSCICFSHPK